jgi:hypothetical protein
MQSQTQPMRQVVECPVCDTTLQVSELACPTCQTRLKGNFPTPPLAQLPAVHQEFILTFMRCRGIIRDVEEALGISYPTVRARLDAVVEALEALETLDKPEILKAEEKSPTKNSKKEEAQKEEISKEEVAEARQRELLTLVENGDLDPSLAAEILRSRSLL